MDRAILCISLNMFGFVSPSRAWSLPPDDPDLAPQRSRRCPIILSERLSLRPRVAVDEMRDDFLDRGRDPGSRKWPWDGEESRGVIALGRVRPDAPTAA